MVQWCRVHEGIPYSVNVCSHVVRLHIQFTVWWELGQVIRHIRLNKLCWPTAGKKAVKKYILTFMFVFPPNILVYYWYTTIYWYTTAVRRLSDKPGSDVCRLRDEGEKPDCCLWRTPIDASAHGRTGVHARHLQETRERRRRRRRTILEYGCVSPKMVCIWCVYACACGWVIFRECNIKLHLVANF